MKIQQKLFLSFLLSPLIAGIIVCFSIANNLSILNNLAQANQDSTKEVIALTKMRAAGEAVQNYADDLLIKQENYISEQSYKLPTKIQIHAGIKLELNNLTACLNKLKTATHQSNTIQKKQNELVALGNLEKKIFNYNQFVSQYLYLTDTDTSKAALFLNQSLKPYFRTVIVPLIEEVSVTARAELTKETKKIEQDIACSNIITITLAGLSFIISIILSLLLSSAISQPIAQLKKAAIRIAKGNWNTTIEIKNKDEFGSLAKAFNQINEALKVTTVSKAYLDSILKTMVNSLIVLDNNKTIVKVNQATLNYLGYAESELVAQPFTKILFQTEVLNDLEKKEVIKNLKVSYEKKDGGQIPVTFSSSLIRDEEGQIQGIVCVAEDISTRQAQLRDRHQAEEEKNLLATAVSHTAEVIEITDTEARFIYVNPAFEQITGYKRSEVIGKTSGALLRSGKHDLAFYQEIANTLNNGRVWSGNYIGKRKDGKLYYQDVTISPVFNLAGLITHHVAVKRDITERKKSDERLEKINQCFLSFKTEPSANINQLTALCGELLGASCALYNRSDTGTLYTVGQWHTPEDYNAVHKLDGSICNDVIEASRDQVFIVNDLLNTKYAHEPKVQQYKLQTYIGQVVKCEGISIGAVCALYKENFIPSEADRKILGIIAAAIGVEEERRITQQALQASEQRYALAAQGANDGLWDWNLLTEEIYFSPRWQAIVGLTHGEIGNSKENWFSLVHPEDIEQLTRAISFHLEGKSPYLENEYRIHHQDGQERWMLVRGLAVSDAKGKPYRLAGSQTDITQKKAAEAQLRYDSDRDSLTGLVNRRLFMERLEEVIARSGQHDDHLFAVLFLDLDRFKVINDSLGHNIGDRLLVEVARTLESCVRPEDTVARLGGDEFTILLDNIKGMDNATQVAQRIQNQLALPFNLNGNEVFTTISMGIALSSPIYKQAEHILRDADMTMYRSKANRDGGQCYQIFDRSIHSKAMVMLQLENDLRRAIGRDEFVLHYQPIISLKNFRISGFEALIRWHHPERGLVSPIQFIPMAEDTGLINAIGYWTLREACSQLKSWQERFPGKPSFAISVNLSTKQFAQTDLIDQIEKVLQITGLESRFLKLEITESVLIENAERVKAMLVKMQQLGVRLSLDDFGTGYSSLSYMHSFPIDTLKIDRSFVTDVDMELGKIEIIRTVVGLAWNLGMDTVAEGVETITQMYQLKALKCNFAQGYYFSRPLDANAAEALIAKERDYFSSTEKTEGLEFWTRK